MAHLSKWSVLTDLSFQDAFFAEFISHLLFHNATQEVYKAMAQLYGEHSEIRKQLDPFHPKLAEFMGQAMKVFADRNLS